MVLEWVYISRKTYSDIRSPYEKEKYVQYRYQAADGREEELEPLEPGYVPDGFFKAEESDYAGMYDVRYIDGRGGELTFDYTKSGSRYLDNEHYNITVNGFEGQYYDSTDERFTNMLIWYNDEGCFFVSSTLGKDEILKFAESIK